MQHPALGTGLSSHLSQEAAELGGCLRQGPWPGRLLGKQTSAPGGPVFPATVVSQGAIAALLLQSMTQLIWLHGLEKMKYDRDPLLFSNPVHPSPLG